MNIWYETSHGCPISSGIHPGLLGPLSWLTLRTIKRAARCLHDAFKRGTTCHTRFPRAVVYEQPFGVEILRAQFATVIKKPVGFRPAKVQRQRAAAFDGIRKDITNGQTQLFDLREGQAIGGTLRRNARAEQGFAGVDISHPGDQRLIQQFHLDGLA